MGSPIKIFREGKKTLVVNIPSEGTHEIEIFSSVGKRVIKKITVLPGKYRFSLDRLEPGFYYLRINRDGKTAYMKKIIHLGSW
jgi:hypothetical protein